MTAYEQAKRIARLVRGSVAIGESEEESAELVEILIMAAAADVVTDIALGRVNSQRNA